jgi:membrane associated rhomboid family serine protease
MRPPESWARARVTLALVLLTGFAYIVVALLGIGEQAMMWGGFIPVRAGLSGDGGLAPFWLTPLTATLLHANLLHVAFNLIILAFCGRPTENVIGPIGFSVLYLVGAFVSTGAHYIVDPGDMTPMVGASGAISAVLGAYAILFGRNKVKVADPRLALWLNALWLMAAWVVLQLIIGWGLGSDGIRIAIAAHIGGFLFGVAAANPLLLLRYRRA